MHILIGLGIIVGLVGFAFGEGAARGVVQAIFVIAGLIAAGFVWLIATHGI
jgi:hypothetical protein